MALHLIIKKISRRVRSAVSWPIRVIKKTRANALAWVCTALTDRYWLLDFIPGRRNQIETILLIRLDLIGDFVLWLDSAKELKNIYPSSRLILYANAVWSDVAQQLPYWDEVISIDVPRLRTDLLYRLRVFFKLRRQSFDIALQPTFSREYIGDAAIRASAAKQRIAHLGDLNNITEFDKRLTDTWYTKLVVVDQPSHMELQTNAHFISSLGKGQYAGHIPYLPILCELPPHLIICERYIVIIPGASWIPRAWPVEYFAALIQQLGTSESTHFILCGTAGEKDLCEHLMGLCPSQNIRNLAGRTNLSEMTEILRGAALVVANESAAIHIAAATGTPSICITGGGHYGRFMPYQVQSTRLQNIPVAMTSPMPCFGCRWICPFKAPTESAVPCISNIAVTDVIEKCKILFNTKADQDSNDY